MSLIDFLRNRVWLGMVIFLVAIAVYEFQLKPQYKPIYEQGIKYYQQGDYVQALDALQRANQIDPNALDVSMMLGWTELKLKHYEEARYFFNRTLKIDPNTDEARVGSAFVAVETGRGELDPELLKRILNKRKSDPNLRVLVAAALVNSGHAYQGASMFRELLNDVHYGATARSALDNLYGVGAFPGDNVAQEMPVVKRSSQLRYEFRAYNRSLWHLSGTDWQPMYVAGVNFSPAAPGYFPSMPPSDGSLYAQWLKEATQLNANTLRVYSLLPPAFYRAYQHYTDAGGKMALLQQIWVPQPPNYDLYDPKFTDDVKKGIRAVVDSIHGRGEIAPLAAGGGGIYDVDISEHVAGLMLGGDVNGTVRARTDVQNIERSRFDGKYIALRSGSATEVWYAQMLDYLVDYETTNYNHQRPVAVVNVLSTDPMNDPIEARLQPKVGLAAGLFAAYSAFPYFPEPLLRNPQLLHAADREGPNPVYGWLRGLRASIPYPVVVSEFGIANSLGVSQFQQNGWNHGGHSQTEQAELVQRLERGIRQAGVAGELVFELIDEWHRRNWPNEGFASPADHRSMWLNAVDPAPHYGLIGFHPSGWKLFSGAAAEWQTTAKLAAEPSKPDDKSLADAVVRSVRVASDEAYLYLRLEGACLGCTRDGSTPAYAIAINTLPQVAGIQKLPFGNVLIPHAANFVVYLPSPTEGQLLVADNYNPFLPVPNPEIPNQMQVVFRRGFMAKLSPNGEFNKLGWQPHKAPDGATGGDYSLSALHYGEAAGSADQDDSLAEWYWDAKEHAIVLRLSWTKLLITDPSGTQALLAYSAETGIRTTTSNGIEISVFTLKQGAPGSGLAGTSVVSSLPPDIADHITAPPSYMIKRWASVKMDPYRKKAYFAVQQMFAPAPAETAATPQPRNRAAVATRNGAIGR
jgi:tetratricopeptide (TPR) repeat protein